MAEPGKRRREGRRDLPVVKLVPNLVTLAAVCAGMTAVRFGFEGRFEGAVGLILLAGILDGMDGRLARLLRSQSLVGAELDSLADFLNFGVTPALVLYAWSLSDLGGLGWIAVLCFALCCLLRLARFNVGTKAGSDGGTFFVGVPSPAGAVLALLPMVVSFLVGDTPLLPAWLSAGWVVLVGLLMISKLPTHSFKNLTVSRENARFFLLGAVLLTAGLLTYPWATLILLCLVYIGGIVYALGTTLSARRKE